jgi:hypothetical protein
VSLNVSRPVPIRIMYMGLGDPADQPNASRKTRTAVTKDNQKNGDATQHVETSIAQGLDLLELPTEITTGPSSSRNGARLACCGNVTSA